MSHLFSPIKIKNVEFKNRLVVSPMCEYSSEDGFANNWHLVHLGSRAVGGAALIITEATAVSPEGRISYGDLGIYKDEHVEKLKEITGFIHEHGSVAGIQLAHAGRKASHEVPWKGNAQIPSGQPNGWKAVAPSAIPFAPNEEVPIELDKAGIEKIKGDFKLAAARALAAGFKVIEIHAAHGYLLNEFLSPISNHRTDEYGGSFENRTRLLLDIVDAVRSVLTETLPLFVRISAFEWVEGGWSIDDSVQLAKLLKTKDVDVIDCSSGGNSSNQKIDVKPLYQVPFAEQVKREAEILTGAVGLITTAQQAEDILQKQQADMIILARQLLREPYFPLHAAKELDADIPWPIQYERAKR
jgi:2,4-dienoyl-CoA reductase-like NADH-dependent reductase (Old Yellow Enzyme family)